MPESIYHICYFSSARFPADEPQISTHITDILNVAQRNNLKSGITGALLYSGGYFIQVLEGPEAAVEATFEAIQNDTRHGEVHLVSHQHQSRRCFPDWSMALVGKNAELPPRLKHLVSAPEAIQAEEDGRALVRFMVDLLEKYENYA